jgi:hypothetical protein
MRRGRSEVVEPLAVILSAVAGVQSLSMLIVSGLSRRTTAP